MLTGSGEQEVAGALDALVGGARQTRFGGPPPQRLPVCGRNRDGSAAASACSANSSAVRGRDPADLRALEMSVDKMGPHGAFGWHGHGNSSSDLQDFRANLSSPLPMTALLLRMSPGLLGDLGRN